MKTSEIRQKFLDYYERQGHQVVASSSLVPGNDPTLLFTNAGMVQFKDVFLGKEVRPYRRATTSQRCVRAGGKHNDLENVGYTARHHTFFEMLGNFSFGDYFKRDAIRFAWEFLTTELALPKERLWVTVFETDDEAYDIWAREIGIPVERIMRIGAKDNFWQMGDTGPCGPCTEIFYDHGPHVAGGPPGSPDQDGDRYIEVWNLVFMQYNRDEAGVLHPLPKPSVDTGMGLERISAVMQGVTSNYEIDLFQALLQAAMRVTAATDPQSASLRVIADHIRACAFLITDGVIPGNEGRGYVLRRIIRRAIRHGYKLGQKKPFFHQLVADLVQVMGDAYPELVAAQQRVTQVLLQEEQKFAETLDNGMALLEAALKGGKTVLDGETAFTLYDTHGFPVDLTADIAREQGFTVDMEGFDAAMERQRKQSQANSRFATQQALQYEGQATEFHGYHTLETDAKVLALYHDGSRVAALSEGQDGVVVLDKTPFYAESGGQVGDSGRISDAAVLFAVEDTQKIQAEVFGHHGRVARGTLREGEVVRAEVDTEARQKAANNHTATHLLHAALRQVLGSHVQQKGSLVEPERLRFDFLHTQPVTDEELLEIEQLVNAEIRKNHEVAPRSMAYDQAIAAGAMALFGEKYGDEVRVISLGDFSTELCGGTHVARSGDIGLFKIVAESGVAAGIRRIEAVTADAALAYVQQQQAVLESVADNLKAQPAEAAARLTQLLDNMRHLEREVARLKSKLAASQGDDLLAQAVAVGNSRVLAATLEGADTKVLRETLDTIKEKLKSCAVVLATVSDGKVSLIAGVTADLTGKIKAGELVNFVAGQVGGKGGGRPDMAQAGGTQPENLGSALAGVGDWVRSKLA